jgi:hypothetical protein
MFKHPLLDGIKPFTEEQLQYLMAADKGDDLIMGLRSCIRHTIGRFLANWVITKDYRDEMVSEAFVAIVSFVNGLPENLKDRENNIRPILKVAQQQVKDHIEQMLNKCQAMAAAGKVTQSKLISGGKEPIYLKSETISRYIDKPELDSDEYKRDIIDALEALEAKDVIDRTILAPMFWGRPDKEIAEYLNVPRETIRNRRARLYKEFLNLTR